MLGFQGPAQPSPALGDALNAGYHYLEVKCLQHASDGGADPRSGDRRRRRSTNSSVTCGASIAHGFKGGLTSVAIWWRCGRRRFPPTILHQHGGRVSEPETFATLLDYHQPKSDPDAIPPRGSLRGQSAPMTGVFPDYPAPVIRIAGTERELILMRWGMPPPLRTGGPPVTNIRNTSSPHWRCWLKPENRCLVYVQQLRRIRPRAEPGFDNYRQDVGRSVVVATVNAEQPQAVAAGGKASKTTRRSYE
jgi:hypothetical protein